MKTYNATRHWQDDNVEEWKSFGIEFVSTGPGVNTIPPRSGVDRIIAEVEEVFRRIQAADVDAVLIGGITGIASLLAVKCVNAGYRVIEPSVSHKTRQGLPVIVGYRDLTDHLKHEMDIIEGIDR